MSPESRLLHSSLPLSFLLPSTLLSLPFPSSLHPLSPPPLSPLPFSLSSFLPPQGKWTTYRSMAEETTDKLVEIGEFTHAKECQTDGYILDGGDGWYETLFIRLIQDFGVDVEVCAILLTLFQDLSCFLFFGLRSVI